MGSRSLRQVASRRGRVRNRQESNQAQIGNEIMGTSSSSNGSPSNVPMVPPWVPDLPSSTPEFPEPDPPAEIPPTQPTNSAQLPPPEDPSDGGVDLETSQSDGSEQADGKVRIAPEGRFQSARSNL